MSQFFNMFHDEIPTLRLSIRVRPSSAPQLAQLAQLQPQGQRFGRLKGPMDGMFTVDLSYLEVSWIMGETTKSSKLRAF